jgi:hypothetical protein
MSPYCVTPNPAVDPVPFGHWTLRDEAAQRRSPPRCAGAQIGHFLPVDLVIPNGSRHDLNVKILSLQRR